MSEMTYQSEEFINRLKDAFDEMVLYKDLKKSNFISSFKLPSFMRDWVIKRFQSLQSMRISRKTKKACRQTLWWQMGSQLRPKPILRLSLASHRRYATKRRTSSLGAGISVIQMR